MASLVLIAPLGSDENCWNGIALNDLDYPGDRIPAFFPGQGGEPRRADVDLPTLADEFAATHDGEFDLVAVAFGVSLASQLLVRHPDRVRSAMLVSAGFTPEADAAGKERIRERGARVLAGGMESVTDEMLERWFTLDALLGDAPGVKYSRATLLATDPHAWAELLYINAQRKSVDENLTRAIACPVSLVAPIRDATGGMKNLLRLHELVERSRLDFIDGPHMVHLERPAAFLDALDRHLTWVAAGGYRVNQPVYAASAA